MSFKCLACERHGIDHGVGCLTLAGQGDAWDTRAVYATAAKSSLDLNGRFRHWCFIFPIREAAVAGAEQLSTYAWTDGSKFAVTLGLPRLNQGTRVYVDKLETATQIALDAAAKAGCKVP